MLFTSMHLTLDEIKSLYVAATRKAIKATHVVPEPELDVNTEAIVQDQWPYVERYLVDGMFAPLNLNCSQFTKTFAVRFLKT